ncbi:MAG: hypothetical protein ACK4V6_20540 [Microthrixaceae bacterium]
MDAFLLHALKLMRPGPGRSIYVVEEPELGGAGRPDLVFVTIPAATLRKYQQSGLRLSSQASARLLDSQVGTNSRGVSPSYAQNLRRELAVQGWTQVKAEHLASMVTDTFAVEAKIRDWRRAMHQVARFRRMFDRSAILMPQRELPPETWRSLDFYRCGLLFRDGSEFDWVREPTTETPPMWSRLWLLELILRGLDSGRAYKLSDFRKSARASR